MNASRRQRSDTSIRQERTPFSPHFEMKLAAKRSKAVQQMLDGLFSEHILIKHVVDGVERDAIGIKRNGLIYPVAHLQEEVIAGQEYAVAVAHQQYEAHAPIIPILHKDNAFNFPWEHVHIDGRFLDESFPYITDDNKKFVNITGRTNHVIVMNGVSEDGRIAGTGEVERLSYNIMTAQKHESGLDFDRFGRRWKDNVWREWQRSYIGKKCHGRKCPHFGAIMHDRGTHYECPLHGLMADKRTCTIIERPL